MKKLCEKYCTQILKGASSGSLEVQIRILRGGSSGSLEVQVRILRGASSGSLEVQVRISKWDSSKSRSVRKQDRRPMCRLRDNVLIMRADSEYSPTKDAKI